MWRKRKTRHADALAGLQADRAEARRQQERLACRRPLVEKLAREADERVPQNHFIETLNMRLKGTR